MSIEHEVSPEVAICTPQQEQEEKSPLDMPEVVIYSERDTQNPGKKKVLFKYDGLEGVTVTKLK